MGGGVGVVPRPARRENSAEEKKTDFRQGTQVPYSCIYQPTRTVVRCEKVVLCAHTGQTKKNFRICHHCYAGVEIL